MQKKRYYVEMEQSGMGLSEVQTGENTIQYAVDVTPEEKEKLEKQIDEIKHENASGGEIVARAVDERNADAAKNKMQEKMDNLYIMIFEFGTPETKDFIHEIRSDLV